MQKTTLAEARVWDQMTEASVLRTLNRFAVDLITIPSEEDLFWYVAQNVVGQLNFVDCVIYQANPEQTELRQVAAWGEKNPFGRSILNPLVIPFGRGITGSVAESQRAVIVDDLLKDLNYIADTQLARSEICVPLVFRGRVVGVIDSEHPEPCAFGDAELEILSTVAAMTSAKLELLAEAQRSAQRYKELVVAHAQMTLEVNTRKTLEAKLFEARKMEAIGRLSGRFAHEFNNLLTTILGNLELLGLNDAPPENQAFLDDAVKAAGKGARLVRDMLVFAQRTRLVPSVVNVNHLITTFCETNANSLASSVNLELAENLWPLWADKAAIESILSNLVENAQDAVAAGGEIHVKTQNILHTILDQDGLGADLPAGRYVRISVTDSGVGIPEDRLSQIFDPFFTTKPIGRGTGLGLSIVLGFAQQSGGSVSVTSVHGKGSTFYVNLPAQPDSKNLSLTKQ